MPTDRPQPQPEYMHARAQSGLPGLEREPSTAEFYRPPGAPLRPAANLLPAEPLPEDPAYTRRLIWCAAGAGLLVGLVLGFGAAWLAAGWMWAQ